MILYIETLGLGIVTKGKNSTLMPIETIMIRAGYYWNAKATMKCIQFLSVTIVWRLNRYKLS